MHKRAHVPVRCIKSCSKMVWSPTESWRGIQLAFRPTFSSNIHPPNLQTNRPTGLLLGSINWQGDLIVSTHQIFTSSQSCTSPGFELDLTCSQMCRTEQPKCEIKVTSAGYKRRYPLGLMGLQGALPLEGF